VAPLTVAADATADPVLRDVTRWREAGANGFHVGLARDSWVHTSIGSTGSGARSSPTSAEWTVVPRNVEVKARLDDLPGARAIAERLGARFTWADEQVDRYYELDAAAA